MCVAKRKKSITKTLQFTKTPMSINKQKIKNIVCMWQRGKKSINKVIAASGLLLKLVATGCFVPP